MKRYALITAGGSGLRMKSNVPKQFLAIGGRPTLMWTLERFHSWDAGVAIIVTLPAGFMDYWKQLCCSFNCVVPHTLVEGGETRFHSIKNALDTISEHGLIAIHDGVRPFVSNELITACFDKAAERGAAIPVIRATDSLREVDDAVNDVHHYVDRSRYVAVQTPQVFRTEIIIDAYRQAYSPEFTDDATVVEAAGGSVSLVESYPSNIKITTPLDILFAEAILNDQNQLWSKG